MPAKNSAFTDPRVSDYQSVIDGLNEPAEVFILEGESDGLTRVTRKGGPTR